MDSGKRKDRRRHPGAWGQAGSDTSHFQWSPGGQSPGKSPDLTGKGGDTRPSCERRREPGPGSRRPAPPPPPTLGATGVWMAPVLTPAPTPWPHVCSALLSHALIYKYYGYLLIVLLSVPSTSPRSVSARFGISICPSTSQKSPVSVGQRPQVCRCHLLFPAPSFSTASQPATHPSFKAQPPSSSSWKPSTIAPPSRGLSAPFSQAQPHFPPL